MKKYTDFMIEQKGSAKTSRNFVAKGFKMVSWKSGTSNFDIGGGKFEKSTEYLKKQGVTNYVYDPYNRSASHNKMAWEAGNEAETTTIFNVLNVIPSVGERKKVLRQGKRANTKFVYIIVYEKDGTSVGEKTRDGWQNNKKLIDYLPEVQAVYGNAYIKKGMIIATV